VSAEHKHTWRGPELKLPPPKVNGDATTTVRAGAPVVIVNADEESALVAFPPCPFLFKLPRELWEHVHDETPQPVADASVGGWDGTTLTPDMLLRMLQHPNAVQIVKALVETRGPEAKAAVMPLINPLVSALVPPEHMGFVKMALAQYVK
jgi:hypothetical protein